ncbi:hypothetical protein J3Q64DRAFT_1869297 [Phycomyces blakesleeanus]|uniref:Uncharacterized protein n=2 Tax=Phycomyces blakesleeanus TaxID=4837 RepID=A0A162PWA4_PHYB8|nr:hypothetical protein PHYBLDRAFT_63204 [Phycomyces blakesleeanus NRRL 1555(-)]OAD76587.1 hypothetical protein PHYBLDRAFT_63204 [Phycomyces blakesleeanus NRRL 1555(-)]|eukprot:XP_018294627.1 hypothetical protein PHYBLDRAFT_63204 [Phycomyces blakesleeanus NRRL 1555(-)]
MIFFQCLYFYKSIIITVLLYFHVIKLILGSYVGPSEGLEIPQPRLYAATFTYSNKLYIYGGMVAGQQILNVFTSVSMSTEDGSGGQLVYEKVPQNISGPWCSYSQAVILGDNRTAMLFTGFENDNEKTQKRASWKEVNAINITALREGRVYFTATLAPNGYVYIYGGLNPIIMTILNDFLSFNPRTFKFETLTKPNQRFLYGHTATALPNGQIVFISRATSKHPRNYMYSQSSRELYTYAQSPRELIIYDINTDEWTHINATGEAPEGHMEASAVLVPYICRLLIYHIDIGNNVGSNVDIKYFKDIFLLHTASWIWSKPTIGGIYPGARTSLSMEFLDTNILAVEYRGSLSFPYKDMNILCIDNQSTPEYSWLSGPDEFLELNNIELPQYKMKGAVVAGIIIAIVFAIILGFFAWKTYEDIYYMQHLIGSFIWDRRDGEPMWTELSRLIIQCILIFLFLAYLVFSVRQALDSPTTSITIIEKVLSVAVPDMRFCFEGNIIKSQASQFTFNGSPQEDTTIRITQYAPGMDPNVKVYSLDTSDVPLIMSDQAVNEWAMRDIEGKNDPNTFTMYANDALVIQYQIKDHQYLTDSGRNKIGILSSYNHTPEISYSYVKNNFTVINSQFGTYFGGSFGSATIYPIEYANVVEQDQKIYTIVNSLGSVCGILSIMFGIQAWLFGFRPKSPWGVVQSWSWGSMKRSLSRKLQTKFDTLNTPVPFVSPINARFSGTNKASDRQSDKSKTMLLEDQKDEELDGLRDRLNNGKARAAD